MRAAFLPPLFAFAALVLVTATSDGCAAPHPEPETEQTTSSDTLVGTISAASAPTAAHACEPGALRACKTYWYDYTGQIHCEQQQQACRADGADWLPCGDLDGGVLPDAAVGEDAGY